MHLGTSESEVLVKLEDTSRSGSLEWSKQEGHGSRRIFRIALKEKQILFLVYFHTTTR